MEKIRGVCVVVCVFVCCNFHSQVAQLQDLEKMKEWTKRKNQFIKHFDQRERWVETDNKREIDRQMDRPAVYSPLYAFSENIQINLPFNGEFV